MAFQFAGRRLNDRIEAFPKPTIAAVNGYALGGGFEIVLCCDLIVVTTAARLGLPRASSACRPAAAARSGCSARSAVTSRRNCCSRRGA